MSKAKFPVVGRLDNASTQIKGVVTIDRKTGVFEVRPHRGRTVYRLPLNAVADMVCQAILRAEAIKK